MKNKRLIIIIGIVLVLLLIFLTIFLINVLNKNNIFQFMFSNKTSESLCFNDEYDNDIGIIVIDSTASDIQIKHTDEDKIKVMIYGDSKYVDVSTKNNRLNININRTSWFGEKIYKIELYVPITYDKYFDISNNYGDIDISSFINSNFEIDSDYGNIYIDGANRLELANELGDVSLNQINIASIDVSLGNVDIDTINELNIDSELGNIEVGSIKNLVNIESDCGNITISSANLKAQSSIDSSLGDINISYTNNIDILAKTNIGNLNIKKDNDISLIRFNIKSNIGNININE